MLHIPEIGDYLKFLTDEEVKDFVVVKFGEYFKSIRDPQNLRKFAKSFYISPTTPDEIERYVQSNSFDNCLYHYNVEILNLFDPALQVIHTKWFEKV